MFNAFVFLLYSIYLFVSDTASFSILLGSLLVSLFCLLIVDSTARRTESSVLLLSEKQPQNNKLCKHNKAAEPYFEVSFSQQYSRISSIGLWMKIDVNAKHAWDKKCSQKPLFVFLPKWQLSQRNYKSLCRMILWHNTD